MNGSGETGEYGDVYQTGSGAEADQSRIQTKKVPRRGWIWYVVFGFQEGSVDDSEGKNQVNLVLKSSYLESQE